MSADRRRGAGDGRESRSPALRRPSFVLLLILLLAFALRVVNIEAQSIWGDEAFSIYTAKQSLAYIVRAGTDVHPPLYHLLLHGWLPLTGDSPLAVRFFSAVCSMVIVVCGYALAQQVTGDRGQGTAAAFLLAISPFHIYYAQETRMYAQVAALCALSLVFLVRWQEAGGKWAVAWFITTLLALYTQYFAFFILAAQDLWLIAQWLRNRSAVSSQKSMIAAWLAAHLLFVLCYLPWVLSQIVYLANRANTRLDTLSAQGAWHVLSQSLAALFVGATLDVSLQSWVALGAFALAVVGVAAARRIAAAQLLALAVVLPLAGAVALNPLLPYFRERFMLLASLPFIVLMAHGITTLLSRRAYPASLAVVALIALFTLNNYWTDPRYHKGEYDRAIAAIRAQAQPNDAVIIYSPVQDAIYDYYRIAGLAVYAMPDADLDAIRAQHPRVWLLLYGDRAVYDPTQVAEAYLSAHGFKTFFASYRDGALARYDFAHGDAVVENRQITFGDAIVLTAYALPSVVARGVLPVTLQWQARAPLAENYTVFVHLLGADGKVLAQMDTQPVGGTRPTTTWQVGETIRDNIGVTIATDVPAGRYRVEIGLYQVQNLRRLTVREAGDLRVLNDALIIGEVEAR